ncbi:MAG: LEA/WHy family protein [Acidimicrobiales bacterium]
MSSWFDAWADLAQLAVDRWIDCIDLWCPTDTTKAEVVTTTVSVTGACRLRPTAFLDGEGHSIVASQVTLAPTSVPAGSTATVTVTVRAPAGQATGAYVGAIVDDAARIVVRRVLVTILA